MATPALSAQIAQLIKTITANDPSKAPSSSSKRAVAPPTVIPQLPDDALLHVFGCLEAKELMAAASVNRAWARLLGSDANDDVWQLAHRAMAGQAIPGIIPSHPPKSDFRALSQTQYRRFRDFSLGLCTSSDFSFDIQRWQTEELRLMRFDQYNRLHLVEHNCVFSIANLEAIFDNTPDRFNQSCVVEINQHITALTLAADGTLFYCIAYLDAAEPSVIKIRQVDEKGEWVIHPSLQGHIGNIYALVLSSDGKTLFSAGEDQIIKVWNRQEKGWECTHNLEGHRLSQEDRGFRKIVFLKLAANDQILFSTSAGDKEAGRIFVWHKQGNDWVQQTIIPMGHDYARSHEYARSVAIHKEGTAIYAIDLAGTIKVRKYENTIWKGKTSLDTRSKTTRDLLLSDDGNTLFALSPDSGNICVWEEDLLPKIPQGKGAEYVEPKHQPTHVLGYKGGKAKIIKLGPDQKTLFVGYDSGLIKAWRKESKQWKCLSNFMVDKPITSIAFDRDWTMYASDSYGTVKAWNFVPPQDHGLLQLAKEYERDHSLSENPPTIRSHLLRDCFSALPQKIREAISQNLLHIHRRKIDAQPTAHVTEMLDIPATNADRAQAIRAFVAQTASRTPQDFAQDFGMLPNFDSDARNFLLGKFLALPEEFRNRVYGELYRIRPPATSEQNVPRYGEYAFLHQHGFTSTSQDKRRAILAAIAALKPAKATPVSASAATLSATTSSAAPGTVATSSASAAIGATPPPATTVPVKK